MLLRTLIRRMGELLPISAAPLAAENPLKMSVIRLRMWNACCC